MTQFVRNFRPQEQINRIARFRAMQLQPPGPDAHPDYFVWSGKGKKNKAASTWQKAFRKLWKLVAPRAEGSATAKDSRPSRTC
jgi:hypothetical protein